MEADTVTKDYVKNVDIFADVFNYYIYGGRQVVQPEQLIERDTAKVALPYGADGAAIPVQRFRDVQKLYAEMTDGKMEYVLYGIENQSEIHYAMAVKNNLYDALEYFFFAVDTREYDCIPAAVRERESGGDYCAVDCGDVYQHGGGVL